MVRDIEWVIFDEVHYVNDAERGVVWEEVGGCYEHGYALSYQGASTCRPERNTCTCSLQPELGS